MSAALDRMLRWGPDAQGSTRAIALVRMGLVGIVWAKWGASMLLVRTVVDGRWPLALVFFVATPLAFLGVWTRVSTALTAACAVVLTYSAAHHHHAQLLASCCVLLALSPSGRSYSFDRWWALRRAGPAPPERGNLWAVRLMSLQVTAVYFWAAYDKCNVGFLSGARIEHYIMYYYTGSDPIVDLPGVAALTPFIAIATVALEFALGFGLHMRRLRTPLIVAGMLLHGTMYATLNIATFTATMWLLYLTFLPSDEVHAFIDRLGGGPSQAVGPPAP